MTPNQLHESFRIDFRNSNVISKQHQIHKLYVHYFLDEKQTGWGVVDVRPLSDERYVEYDCFYPHDFVGERLQRMGIGTLAHVVTITSLVERIKDIDESYIVVHNPLSTSDAYQGLLSVMDIGIREPIYSYVAKSVSYANDRGFDFTNPFDSRS